MIERYNKLLFLFFLTLAPDYEDYVVGAFTIINHTHDTKTWNNNLWITQRSDGKSIIDIYFCIYKIYNLLDN